MWAMYYLITDHYTQKETIYILVFHIYKLIIHDAFKSLRIAMKYSYLYTEKTSYVFVIPLKENEYNFQFNKIICCI